MKDYISIKAVIARIIEDMGPTYNYPFSSMKLWISSCVKKHMSRPLLAIVAKEVEVNAYRVEKPCDSPAIIAVTDKATNCRLHHGLADYDNRVKREPEITSTVVQESSQFYYPAVEVIKEFDADGNLTKQIYGPEFELRKKELKTSRDYYFENGEYLHFSFETGNVIIDYLEYLKDEEGFLMIPNYETFIEAIYYWVLHKLIGRGFKHPVLTYADALSLYKDNARQLSGVMNYPSVDKMESIINSTVEIMPTIDRWSEYGVNREQKYD